MPQINMPEQETPSSSAIKTSKLNNFLSSLFGWRRHSSPDNSSAKSVEFVKVDVGSEEKIGQALANYKITANPLSEKLDKLFNSWMSDNTDKSLEIQNRKNRVDQLEYAVLNEPTLGRVVDLYADEACQLDEQDTILNIETPDPRMTRDMYKLLSQWGITQTRIRSTIKQIATYGDAFWANKVTDKGIERIIPLRQLQVTDRLEFNPVDALEKMKRKEGAYYSFASNNYLIDRMLDTLEDTGDFADLFDTKLFGYSIENDLVVPPWAITHFRLDADSSEFFPFGTSPIIGTLAPFKQVQSTIALQSLARVMSFPIQLYKVKTNESMGETQQFAVVNKVREAYDNIGVNPQAGSSEVYTVNTKLWTPEGLVTVETINPNVETGNIDDLKLYQDRLAVAAGIPKSFFSDEFYEGVGSSGKALTQQYKPFARKVYSIQTAFLESLADLFRIHFAVTGQYDFRIPFTISMKYPAVEETEEHQTSRKNSIDLANTVLEMIKMAVGCEEDEALPPDIVRDVIGKYTFLDAADVVKWTRDADLNRNSVGMDTEHEDEGSTEMEGTSGVEEGDLDFSTDDSGESSAEDLAEEAVEEAQKMHQQRLREKKLTETYGEKRSSIYFDALKECAVGDFNRDQHHIHVCNSIPGNLRLMLETLAEGNTEDRLRESLEK